MTRIFGADAEWLEADGLGGYASGAVSGIRSRRYHALLLAARTPPTDRVALVQGLEVWARPTGKSGAQETPLCAHRYEPGVVHPSGFKWIESFTTDPWPTWVYRLDDGARIQHEIFVPSGRAACVITWRLLTSTRAVSLRVRPLIGVREYHSLQRENGSFNFHAETADGAVTWRPYWGMPRVRIQFNGAYTPRPDWYRNFLYETERSRGLDSIEDLASPGEFTFDLTDGAPEACLILSTDTPPERPLPPGDPAPIVAGLRRSERSRRAALGAGLARAADAYIVRRGIASTIIAGYPWFTDWGRDTFISIRGLCIATGRLEEARQILTEWSRAQVEGLLPNRFPDVGEAPEFNSVDAALWYVQAAHDFLAAAKRARGLDLSPGDEKIIRRTCVRALQAYAAGTMHGIRMDRDGLLSCGEGDSSLTWMDARVEAHAVTPRVGKPVEVQALWINALKLASIDEPKLGPLAEKAAKTFHESFWNPKLGCLFDVLDAGHDAGARDESIRPNQLLAVGGLTHPLLAGERARAVVDLCERKLLTPMGPRTLDPADPAYVGSYAGDVRRRDHAYHNGTVWPWLLGPFVEAWVRVRGSTPAIKREARDRFLRPLLESSASFGLGHIAEIADGDPPHTPGGCPFQAWSVGEALRLDRVVLAE
ncbi:MAG TPA: amylo-alpha-1,6-glucosidase [Phycisphaerales bacterium]|nr:amylo-alpha-1,6-glucosidase [Phycisphaerales bacterium]